MSVSHYDHVFAIIATDNKKEAEKRTKEAINEYKDSQQKGKSPIFALIGNNQQAGFIIDHLTDQVYHYFIIEKSNIKEKIFKEVGKMTKITIIGFSKTEKENHISHLSKYMKYGNIFE